MVAGLSQVKVAVTNTDLDALHWLWLLFGGSVRRTVKPTRKGVRQTYQWNASGDIAEHFLQRVAVHLRVKRSQATCALTFRRQEIDPATAKAFIHQCKRKEDIR